MIRATISQVKNSLSAYLRKVRAGETVLIMDRKTPIASLSPIPGPAAVDPKLERLLNAGVVARRGPVEADAGERHSVPGAPALPTRIDTDVDVLGILLAERRSGR